VDEVRVPRVLVVIVNFRTANLAIAGVKSVIEEQQRSGFDVRTVVVENQSGDEAALRAGLDGLPGVTLIVAERNGGFSYGNNLGFKFAYESGWIPDYFHLLNPDARLNPGGLTELVRFLEKHPAAGIAGSRFTDATGAEWPVAFRFPSLFSELDYGLRVGVISSLLQKWVVAQQMPNVPTLIDWLPGASMMVRREVVEQLGGMDEEYFLYFEETDFCLKAKRAGWETWHVPSSSVMHIAGQSTGVTAAGSHGRPLPGYWFESRSRYFRKNHGRVYAALADAIAVGTGLLGNVKEIAIGRKPKPKFIQGLTRQALRGLREGTPPIETKLPLENTTAKNSAG
jgi:hypothetical protein